MKTPRHITSSIRQNHAFSLVEITLSIGIISYSLLALLGLLAIGLSSSRESELDTRVSQIAREIRARIQDHEAITAGTELSFKYDYDGMQHPESGEGGPDAIYTVTVTFRKPDNTDEIPGTADNLLVGTIAISTPDRSKTFHFIHTTP